MLSFNSQNYVVEYKKATPQQWRGEAAKDNRLERVFGLFREPDEINAIDWTYKTKYNDLVKYYSELAAIRHAHPGFCLGDPELVREKLQFIEVDNPNVVAFRISGLEGIDSAKSLIVLLNGSKKNVKVEIPQGNYVVLAEDASADAEGLGAYTGNWCTAAATSATILAEY